MLRNQRKTFVWWAGLAALVVLVLGLWGLPHQARSEPLLPTFVPTLAPVTVMPLQRPYEQVAPDLAALQAIFEEKLYDRAQPFLEKSKGKWVHIAIEVKRANIYKGKSLLPPESRVDRWIQVSEDGKVAQMFTIEWDKHERIVQMTLSRGLKGEWNSIAGYLEWPFDKFPDSLAYWIQLDSKRLGRKGPFFWSQNEGLFIVSHRYRKEPPMMPAQSTLAYPIAEVEYRWEYSLKSGLLQRHEMRLILSNGHLITELQERYQYQIADALPSKVQPLFEHAEHQFLQGNRK